MTYSIVARDPDSGLFGLAVASRFFAVGAICPWAEAGVGAVMTQALVNPEFGPRALHLLRLGHDAATVCEILIGQDDGAGQRQLHLLDRHGNSAAYTGPRCIDWAGHRCGDGVSVAGNMLAGAEVVDAAFDAWREHARLPIVERLLAALEAGERAGGDKRGRQSAALRIQGPECYPRLDLRADDHPDPLAELTRLYAVARQRYIPFSAGMPRPGRPYGILDRDVIERIIERDAGRPLRADVALPDGERQP